MESLGKDALSCISKFLSVRDTTVLRMCCNYLRKKVVDKLRGYDFSNIEEVLLFACEDNHMDIVNYAIKKGAKNFDAGLVSACKGGRRDFVCVMICKGANSYVEGFVSACWHGHAEVVRYILDIEWSKWIRTDIGRAAIFKGFEMACYGNHLEVVFMLVSGGYHYCPLDVGLKIARQNNHENLEYMLLGIRAGRQKKRKINK